jgi:hypothetical protein
MQKSETLSVRLAPYTRQVLDDEAGVRGVAGASALARDILESWVAEQRSSQRIADVTRAVSFLRAHPEGWPDEPDDFFAVPQGIE